VQDPVLEANSVLLGAPGDSFALMSILCIQRHGNRIVASDQHITARTFPPLMFRMVPVQKLAVARYSTASATSQGSPSLASGTPLCSISLCCAHEIGAELPRALLLRISTRDGLVISSATTFTEQALVNNLY
jgi:hypothetical protein